MCWFSLSSWNYLITLKYLRFGLFKRMMAEPFIWGDARLIKGQSEHLLSKWFLTGSLPEYPTKYWETLAFLINVIGRSCDGMLKMSVYYCQSQVAALTCHRNSKRMEVPTKRPSSLFPTSALGKKPCPLAMISCGTRRGRLLLQLVALPPRSLTPPLPLVPLALSRF